MRSHISAALARASALASCAGLEGPGDVGVWAVGGLDGAGPIYAINAVAQEFSEWGAAAAPGSPIDNMRSAIAASAEVDAVIDCLG